MRHQQGVTKPSLAGGSFDWHQGVYAFLSKLWGLSQSWFAASGVPPVSPGELLGRFGALPREPQKM